MSAHFDAVVLAGGRGSRLGGLDKAAITLGGERLVDRVAGAASGVGARRIIVVGPMHTAGPEHISVREDPPGGGPLAAVTAALPSVEAEWVLLLSCDLRHPAEVCRVLRQALTEETDLADDEPHDGIVLRDEDGRLQWLAAVYSARSLRQRARSLGEDVAGRPLRLLFEHMRLREIPVLSGLTADIDTLEDLARATAEEEVT